MGQNMSAPNDYEQRGQSLGFAPKKEIKNVVDSGKEFYFVDVRTDAEIAQEPFQKYASIHVSCTRDDASPLTSKASELLPNKDANIIVFCRSGARAATAKKGLESMGYKNVHNAGGISDIDYL